MAPVAEAVCLATGLHKVPAPRLLLAGPPRQQAVLPGSTLGLVGDHGHGRAIHRHHRRSGRCGRAGGAAGRPGTPRRSLNRPPWVTRAPVVKVAGVAGRRRGREHSRQAWRKLHAPGVSGGTAPGEVRTHRGRPRVGGRRRRRRGGWCGFRAADRLIRLDHENVGGWIAQLDAAHEHLHGTGQKFLVAPWGSGVPPLGHR